MELGTILSIIAPIIAVGVFMYFMIRHKKNEPITYAEFFLKDKSNRFLHILGAKRIMPDEGDSFDIFEHYVLDLNELKYTRGGSQRGKDLHLESDFVKRSMADLSQKLNTSLGFIMPEEDYDDEESGLLKVYRFDADQSDTEVYGEMSNDNLVFINEGNDTGRFSMIVHRNGRALKKHLMKGMNDYFFKTIYLEDRLWLCFTYRKQKTLLNTGMAVCIIHYETGELIFDGFVSNGTK